MNQYKEITTLQYMGSKGRIISHICEPIIKNNNITTVVDLFAGTGSVGYALKPYKNVISNDIEHYAYVINEPKNLAVHYGPCRHKCNFEHLYPCQIWWCKGRIWSGDGSLKMCSSAISSKAGSKPCLFTTNFTTFADNNMPRKATLENDLPKRQKRKKPCVSRQIVVYRGGT